MQTTQISACAATTLIAACLIATPAFAQDDPDPVITEQVIYGAARDEMVTGSFFDTDDDTIRFWGYDVVGMSAPNSQTDAGGSDGGLGFAVNTNGEPGNGAALLTLSGNGGFSSGFAGTTIDVPLDGTVGFTIDWTMRIQSEFHPDGTQDAGLSFAVVTNENDPSTGIEFGFWTDRIFSRTADFTGFNEEALFTGTELTDARAFSLLVQPDPDGPDYKLSVEGEVVLEGELVTGYQRDVYTSSFSSGTAVFDRPNSIMLGDFSGTASSAFQVGAISATLTPIPEPAALSSVALLSGLLLRRRH